MESCSSTFSENQFYSNYNNIIDLENLEIEKNFSILIDDTTLLLLIPLSGIILVRTEKPLFKFYEFKKSFSLFFIIILIGSTVSMPYSFSNSIWQNAYAEEDKNKIKNKLKSILEKHKKINLHDLKKFNLNFDGKFLILLLEQVTNVT